MDKLKRQEFDGPAFGFEVRHLSADHSAHRARCARDFGNDLNAALRFDGRFRQRLKRQRQQSVAREDGYGLAKFLMARRLAAAQIVVVERREIIVNQRIGVNEFEGTCRGDRCVGRIAKHASGFDAHDRPKTLTARKHAIPHRFMN